MSPSRKIRVVHVITRMVRGGAQQVVLDLAGRMDRDRFEVEVLCGEEDPALLGPLEDVARVTRLPRLVREISPRRDFAALLSLFAGFRGVPEVVHGHTYKAGVLAAVAARHAGVPAVVFTPHGHIFDSRARIPGVPSGGKLAALKAVTRYAQSCAHAVTALSDDDLEDQLKHRLSPRSKYVVIRNGIDVARFGNGRTRGPGIPDAPVIGSIGRLTREKGHRYLVDMMDHLPEARLVVAGDGPERPVLQAAARRSGRIELPGEVDRMDVLPKIDVYVQPSLYESQGLAILEAMAAGVPVIAADVGGISDVVRHERTGLLVPPADPGALAGAVRRLRSEPDLADRLRSSARERVRADYSVDRMIADYERLYLRLLRR